MSKFRVSCRPIFPRVVGPRELFVVVSTRGEAERVANHAASVGMHDIQIEEVTS